MLKSFHISKFPTKQVFNQLYLLSGTAALLCLVTSPHYLTMSQLIKRF